MSQRMGKHLKLSQMGCQARGSEEKERDKEKTRAPDPFFCAYTTQKSD